MTPPKDTKPKAKSRARPAGASWRSADILRAASIVAGLAIILKLLWVANEIVIVAFLGTLFGIAVAAGVDKLERFKVNRGLGAAFLVIVFLMILYTLGSFVAPTIAEQGRELKQRLPDAVERVESWLNKRNPALMSSLLGSDSAQTPAPAESTQAKAKAPTSRDTTATAGDTTTSSHLGPSMALRESLGKKLAGSAHYLFPFLTSTVETVAGLLLILMMSLYIGADPYTYRNGILPVSYTH